MPRTAQDIMALIRECGIRMVDFKMVDINGQFRHVTIPAQNFSEKTMREECRQMAAIPHPAEFDKYYNL